MDDFDFILDNVENKTVFESLVKAKSVISEHNKISCSVSGGADSDIMLDLLDKCDPDKKIKYVWFDTGLEYQATKEQLNYLENEYGIEIERIKPKKPIPVTVKKYGVPFLNKQVSEMMYRLQLHNFKWEDKSFDELYAEYPNCKGALRWWCNAMDNNILLGIARYPYLKEFIIANPPTFKIANKCCEYAKKKPAHQLDKMNNVDLKCIGVRKAEGGMRSTAYKNCYSVYEDKQDEFRPLFWYTDSDKIYYEQHFSVEHSKCYTEYGLKRTGCVGCPYGRDFENELEIVQKYEPKLYKACMNVFGESYEYTRKYREFQKMMKEKERDNK